MAVWPASLPQIALADSFEESAQSVLIRTEMDVGPPKVRARYTAEIKRFRFALVLTGAQVATLETFFTSTIVFGSLPFDWFNPRLQTVVELRLVNRPGYSALGANMWRTELDLEYLP